MVSLTTLPLAIQARWLKQPLLRPPSLLQPPLEMQANLAKQPRPLEIQASQRSQPPPPSPTTTMAMVSLTTLPLAIQARWLKQPLLRPPSLLQPPLEMQANL